MSTPAPDTERGFPSWVLEQLAKQDVVQAVSDIMFGERQPLEDSLFSAEVSIDGKFRVPFAAWRLVLRQAVGVTIEASQRVLALHASNPDWDRLRLRLAEHAADQLAETWRAITGFCEHMT